MDLTEKIQPGMEKEETFLVEEKHLAQHVGSGSLGVLATPWMIAKMERVSHLLLMEYLPKEYSSVGVRVDVQHVAPTPLGATVKVRTEVAAIDGFQVIFNVQAWDEQETIGKGRHQRVVIDHERFLRRVASKTSTPAK